MAKELILRLKYARARAAASDIAASLAAMLPDEPWIICYVPTATNRVRARGYDQAKYIAKEIAHRMELPHTPLLRRLGQRRQVGQKRLTRQEQMSRVFVAINKEKILNKHILLIDDVLTTGATLEAAAAVLKAAGARRVSAAVFAVA